MFSSFCTFFSLLFSICLPSKFYFLLIDFILRVFLNTNDVSLVLKGFKLKNVVFNTIFFKQYNKV
ncbi:hypothetical protein NBO_612g0001 [Nosema bombycis CQ1]|uniref:Uncharacterized protein n=1 Tax=Nosema bombycis (strain CQ1 / CVCC 102059) TaxID=578461 RepID=R0KMT7_NOSB1|nr:hypothetical protein NBO_612g0001 [Nosema bombycis CQ1]|eukprot:EOB11961.1 hypothetical protein NBO_612g0001 [Nosema bombycis CQ1]